MAEIVATVGLVVVIGCILVPVMASLAASGLRKLYRK